jgi:hypothetical protein
MQHKEYTNKEIIYDELYRLKLSIFYFMFTKFALYIMLGSYWVAYNWYEGSLKVFLTVYVLALLVFYKTHFNLYTGEQYNIFLIRLFSKLMRTIRGRS